MPNKALLIQDVDVGVCKVSLMILAWRHEHQVLLVASGSEQVNLLGEANLNSQPLTNLLHNLF